jgi:hypothetical protein
MAQYPQPYTTASPILVSYDFTDISNGTGYETYYLIESQDSVGKDHHLTPTQDYSNNAFIEQAGAGTKDYDYDLTEFIIPKTINGIVIISIAGVGLAGTVNATFTIELYRYDGSSETQIGSTITYTVGLTTSGNMLYFRMPVTNELIPAGEQLRLRVSFANATGQTVRYGIDPVGRTSGNFITTTSKIHVPYKLDN